MSATAAVANQEIHDGRSHHTMTHAFISNWLDYCNVLHWHRRGTLEPSAFSPEHRCLSQRRFRMVETHNTCPAAVPLAAGSSTCAVQAGDVCPPLACRNCTSLPVQRVSPHFICWSVLSALSWLPDMCTCLCTCVHCVHDIRREHIGAAIAVFLWTVLVCRCSFVNWIFHITSYKLYWRHVVLGNGKCGALRLIVKSGVYKHAYLLYLITYLLKKHGLDASDPENYWLISNLNTTSKTLEQLELTRIDQHASLSPNYEVFQSAYKRHYSTERALLKLNDDVFARFADHRYKIHNTFDQSTAFDYIDHTTQIRWLNHSFGVSR